MLRMRAEGTCNELERDRGEDGYIRGVVSSFG